MVCALDLDAMKNLNWIYLIIAMAITACAPSEKGQQASVQTTQDYPTPVIRTAGEYQVVQGATSVQDMVVKYDGASLKMSLKGKLNLRLVGNSRENLSLDLDMLGTKGNDDYVILKTVQSLGIPGLQLAAKATCLGVNGDCSSSFIDIYVAYKEQIYHHQVESTEEKPQQQQQAEVKTPDTKEEDDEDGTLAEETEEDHEDTDEVDEAPGAYVGDMKNDIEKVLEVKPKATPKPTPSPAPKASPTPAPSATPSKEEPKVSGDNTVSIPVRGNQAVGRVNAGRLENGISLVIADSKNVGFTLRRPNLNKHWATSELAYLIDKMGTYTRKIAPDHILRIGNISKEHGGKSAPHKSHQNGLDVDIAFYFKSDADSAASESAIKNGSPRADWMMAQQWELFKYVTSSKFVNRIFIHPALKKALCQNAIKKGELQRDSKSGIAYETLRRLRPESGHYNHFHMRIECSESQIRCRTLAPPPAQTGCF